MVVDLPAPVVRPPEPVTPDRIDGVALERDLREQFDGEVRFDIGSRGAYATDASNYRQMPIGVVVPRTLDAAAAAVAVCRRRGAPLVSRGGGTSLASEATNAAVVLDFSKYCNRLVSVDPKAHTCVVEPGIVLDELNEQLGRYGLQFGPRGTGERGEVVLWPDTFSNSFHPHVAQAAVEVLESAGWRVVVPQDPVSCGLTWISTGQLDVAKRVLRHTSDVLHPHLQRGAWVLGLEPSCTAVFRGDAHELFPDDPDIDALRERTVTLAELLVEHTPGWRPPELHRRAVVQKHCHQHAIMGFDDDVEVFVDANGGYSRGQAARVGRALDERGVTWFEEPVSSDDLDGLAGLRGLLLTDVAAGEYAYDLAYVRRMCAAHAVDCLQLDVTRIAGATEWLRSAAVAAGHGLDVSGHCAPALHTHVAAATPNLRHLEYFLDHARLEPMLFESVPAVRDGRLAPDLSRTGHGLDLRADADRYRVA